jgi:hypothetical protein
METMQGLFLTSSVHIGSVSVIHKNIFKKDNIMNINGKYTKELLMPL